jgi:hypothetical protein
MVLTSRGPIGEFFVPELVSSFSGRISLDRHMV